MPRVLAQEAFFADIFVCTKYDHRIKNYPQLSGPQGPSGNKILVGSLTGSEPEMTTDHISDCLGVLEIRPSFQFHNSVCVLGNLAETCHTATHLLGEKKTTQLLR